jgi:hypothetical protein
MTTMSNGPSFERFADRARKVMALANQEAQRFNHDYIEAHHILLGLVRESDCSIACTVLKNLGIDPRKVRLEVEKTVKSGPDMVTMGKLPLRPSADRATLRAIQAARELDHNYVGTEHLLLALISDDGVAGNVLRGLGLTVDKARVTILELVSPEPTPAPSAPAAMSRETVIETLARAGFDSENGDGSFDKLDKPLRVRILRTAEAQAIAVKLIDAPPPPPQKSEGQKIAESLVVNTVSSILIGEVPFRCCINAKDEREASTTADAIIHIFATAIDSALAARDEEHRGEMRGELEALREACAFSVPIEYRYSVLATPLTKAERSAAK